MYLYSLMSCHSDVITTILCGFPLVFQQLVSACGKLTNHWSNGVRTRKIAASVYRIQIIIRFKIVANTTLSNSRKQLTTHNTTVHLIKISQPISRTCHASQHTSLVAVLRSLLAISRRSTLLLVPGSASQ